MNQEQFNQILNGRLGDIQRVLNNKAKEYATSDDRLHNFKAAGRMLGCTPEQALLGMLTKHLVSVMDMVDQTPYNQGFSTAVINEKIGDCINYFILLEAIMKEHPFVTAVQEL